jgi:acyl-CoA synthetase (AMP-forming)/AMP-acid ligase II
MLEFATLADIPRVNAERFGDAVAITYDLEDISYSSFDSRSNQVANGLSDFGVRAEERIAILNKNSATFFDILFGCAKANATLVTVNFRLAESEVVFILDDSDATLLFLGSEFESLADNLSAALPNLKQIIIVDDNNACRFAGWRDQFPRTAPVATIDPKSAAVQMYTSGTTGNPKGVELSHRAMLNAASAGLDVWQFLFEPNSAVLGTMPLFHIAACNLCIAALVTGARADIVRDASPAELAHILPSKGTNLVPLPATVIHEMLRLPNIGDCDFGALKVMLIAGSGIAATLLKEAAERFDCGFALSYGSTEMCGGVTYLGPEFCHALAGEHLKSAGMLLAHSEIRIVGETGQDLLNGEVGEIVVRSNRLMTKYWNRPDATCESLKDGWFYSGDAGYLDDDGLLYVVDRLKDMVISGGENIYPAEIEQVLHSHPSVEDVAVVGIPDPKWGESLLAFIVLKSQCDPVPAEDFVAYLRPKLAGFKIPRRYEYVTSFPRNAMGKVLKRTLRQPYWA